MVVGVIFRLVSSIFKTVGNIFLAVLGALGLRTPLWNLFTHILTNYRTPLVVFVVLPMSFFFDLYWRGRTWYIAKVKSAPEKHPERVANIQEQVREWKRQGSKNRMCTARPGWLTVSPRHSTYKSRMFNVSVDLTDVLELDTKNRVLKVEPSVNILQILDYLLPLGYTLPVIPELDELTIGGLINGYGIETSSHHYGLFNDIAVAYEIVLPNAEVKRVTPKDKLFHCIPWSYGTLGFLTAVELKVIPATKYVRHKYIPVYSTKEACKLWTELQTAEDSPDFLEGFLYSETEGVIMAAWYHNDATPKDPPVNNINWWYKPYFYKHALQFVQEKRTYEELIPLRQYYQRHNRSIFWALQDQVPMCHNPVFRFFLGWTLPPRVPFLKLIESPSVTEWYEEKYVLQDFMVPLKSMEGLVNLCHKELAVYPLWLCPYRVPNNGPLQGKVRAPKGTKAGQYAHYIDCAAVGQPLIKDFDCGKAIRTLEEFLRDAGGIQGNYSYTYQTNQEFREMFDHTMYDEVRKEVGADKAFVESYEKLARKNQWRAKPLPPLLTQ